MNKVTPLFDDRTRAAIALQAVGAWLRSEEFREGLYRKVKRLAYTSCQSINSPSEGCGQMAEIIDLFDDRKMAATAIRSLVAKLRQPEYPVAHDPLVAARLLCAEARALLPERFRVSRCDDEAQPQGLPTNVVPLRR